MQVPGPLQTVQRAEFWCTILALQAFWPGHLGVDNLNPVQSIARLLDHGSLSRPLPLVKDWDLIALVRHMPDTVSVTRLRFMILRLMWSRVECGQRTGSGMLGLTLLLTWAGGISRRAVMDIRRPWLLLGSSGIPLCSSFIVS